MILETKRFGPLDVDANAIVTLTQPILGFQEYRRFLLLPGPGEFLRWLQSVDSGELAFILMDPRVVIPDYTVELKPQELTELAATSPDELSIFTLVVVPSDPAQTRTNLRAPVLINEKQRLGKQTILDQSDYPIQFFLSQTQRAQEEPRETSNARADT